MPTLSPDADDTDGGWVNEAAGSSLFDHIDESSFNDSDYIRSPDIATQAVCKIRISDPSGAVDTGQPFQVSYRYRKQQGLSSDSASINVSLLEGSTVIASWSHFDIGTSFVNATQTLTAPELAAISDFNDLYLQFSNYAPLFLDLTTATPFVAFSNRRVRSGYTGNALRVRRSSDDTEQDIGFDGEDLDQAALLSFVGTGGSDNGFVTDYYDQGGGGRDVAAAATAQQPTIVSAGVVVTQNAQAVCQGGSSIGLTRASTVWTSGPLISFFVAKIDTRGANPNGMYELKTIPQVDIHGILLSVPSGSGILSGTTAEEMGAYGRQYNGSDPIVTSLTGFGTSWHQCDLKISSGTNDIILDGSAMTLNLDASTADPVAITDEMFLLNARDSFGYGLNGKFAEFVIFNSDPGTTDRATLRANQKTYWGTP